MWYVIKFSIPDCAPKLIGGRAFFPLRHIFEAFGFTVNWDEEKRLITINITPSL